MKSRLRVNPVFTGLTRPPMFLGVTVDYLFICFFVSYGAFMLTADPLFLVTYLPMHGFGWIACKFDPNFFRVLMKRMECPNVRNQKQWSCQSYDPS